MLSLSVEVFDGDQALGPCRVAVDGDRDRIVEVAPLPRDAEVDTGLSLIPGLIDTHVHLVGDAAHSGADFYTWPLVTTPQEQTLHALAHAQAALDGGVTTVRDMTADEATVAVARAGQLGLVTACRVVNHGMVSMTAGHHDLFLPAAVRERRHVADGADASRALVREFARLGVDGIKVATSGGVLSVGDRSAWRNHTDAELDAIVDEAHALGMLVAAHAHTAEGVRRALDHGVDSLEHATLIDEPAARLAAERHVTIAPTLLINEVLAEGAVPVTAYGQQKAAELVVARDAALRTAAAAGVRFVLGTDANGFHVRFGDQMREIVRMATVLGLSPDDALRSATSWAAQAIGQGHRLGRLRPGFAGDALLVRGRPWADLRDLAPEAIVAVVSRSRVVRGRLPDHVLN